LAQVCVPQYTCKLLSKNKLHAVEAQRLHWWVAVYTVVYPVVA